MPAKAGIQRISILEPLDSGFRRNDEILSCQAFLNKH